MNFEEKLPKSIIVHIDRFSLSRDLQLEALRSEEHTSELQSQD